MASIAEDGADLVAAWTRLEGSGDRTVVLLSGLSGLAPVDGDAVRNLRSRLKNGPPTRGTLAPTAALPGISLQNYLSAAAEAGIVKTVYWVIPQPLLNYSDAERRVREFLASETGTFDRRDIGAMRYARGCVEGTVHDVPVAVCGPETLPPLESPVLFVFDVNYIGAYASSRKFTSLRGFKELFDQLVARKLRVASVQILYPDDAARSVYRYLGMQVQEVLRKPDMLRDAPPQLWTIREAVQMRFDGHQDVRADVRKALKSFPADMPLRLFGALSGVLQSRGQAAADLAALCREDTDVCAAIPYAVSELKKRVSAAEADRFLKQLSPGAASSRPDFP